MKLAAGFVGDGLGLQVHAQFKGRRELEERGDRVAGEDDGEKAVLVGVVAEDFAERGGDDAAEAGVHQRPNGVLAGGAAAEVVARQEDLRALAFRTVQGEVGDARAVLAVHSEFAAVGVAPFVKQEGAEAGAANRAQELLGDDLVGVHIGAVQRRNEGMQREKLFHDGVRFGLALVWQGGMWENSGGLKIGLERVGLGEGGGWRGKGWVGAGEGNRTLVTSVGS